ncbi:MAG TPA: hypothetical protein VEC06_04300 [Paucimonas sp.]|nr:hypothetical protein [Paucimonas sp.]
METKKLSDGSYLVATGRNIHLDHIHVAPDGTILSHKVDGVASYKYSNTRKDLSALYEEITGESNRFSGGWNAG